MSGINEAVARNNTKESSPIQKDRENLLPCKRVYNREGCDGLGNEGGERRYH